MNEEERLAERCRAAGAAALTFMDAMTAPDVLEAEDVARRALELLCERLYERGVDGGETMSSVVCFAMSVGLMMWKRQLQGEDDDDAEDS